MGDPCSNCASVALSVEANNHSETFPECIQKSAFVAIAFANRAVSRRKVGTVQ